MLTLVMVWLKGNWRACLEGLGALAVILSVSLWQANANLKGALSQCQASELTMEKEMDANANTIQDLRAKVNAKCKGTVDFTVAQPAEWNSLMNPAPYPCPKVTFHADMDGSSDMEGRVAATSTATAKVTEKPEPGTTNQAPAWGLSVGGGLSLPGATIYHGSAALDYRALRAIGTLDTKGTWTAGAQVQVLTWNWP